MSQKKILCSALIILGKLFSIPFKTFNIKQNVSKMFKIQYQIIKFKDTKDKDHTLNRQFPCIISKYNNCYFFIKINDKENIK